jgi:hypothetical protein
MRTVSGRSDEIFPPFFSAGHIARKAIGTSTDKPSNLLAQECRKSSVIEKYENREAIAEASREVY